MYIYRTRGICPPEIHFQLSGSIMRNVRFVGGGCKGNAQLISRLLEGRDVTDVLPLLKSIECRNNTSCPDQLFQAVRSAISGELREADAIRVYADPQPRREVAVIAEVNGNLAALDHVLANNFDALYCLGNLTGPGGDNDGVVERARKKKICCIQGPFDGSLFCKKTGNQDFLLQAPHFVSFQLGEKRVLGFHSGFIQDLNGFSDFSPHSLELLMVSNLSDYLRKEEVYPALQAMTEQFQADVVLFAGTNTYKHVRLGRVDFINVGPVEDGGVYGYALLKLEHGQLTVSFEKKPVRKEDVDGQGDCGCTAD